MRKLTRTKNVTDESHLPANEIDYENEDDWRGGNDAFSNLKLRPEIVHLSFHLRPEIPVIDKTFAGIFAT